MTAQTRVLRAVRVGAFLAAISCGAAASVVAQGYGLYEQGACEMARAGAGVAAPCDDGSSLYFNPAGLAAGDGSVANVGFTAVAPRGRFTDDATGLVSPLSDKTYLAPSAYFSMKASPRLAFGLGLFAPYGLTTEWPTTSEGRFLGYKSAVHSIYVQPTVAYRVTDQLLVGGGIDITHTSLELRRRVDLATTAISGAGGLTFGAIGVPPGTDFADVDLTGSGTHVGAHVGVLVNPEGTLSFGARYLTRQEVTFDNADLATTQVPTGLLLHAPLPGLPPGTPFDAIVRGAFQSGGPLSAQTASTSLPLPDQFVAGVAFRAAPALRLMVDYQYTHWTLLDRITIQNEFAPQTVLVESFKDTHGIRVGADYAVGRGTVRLGFDAHNAAAPDQTVTPLLPDASRREIAAGGTLPLSAHLRIDAAYMYVHQSDRNGRTTDGGLAVPTVAVNNGIYHYYANLFGASLVVHF